MKKANLKLIFAVLFVYKYNMQIIHWKIKGNNWEANHKEAQDYYKKLDEMLDDVAEIILMTGDNILAIKNIIPVIKEDEKMFTILTGNEYYDEHVFHTYTSNMFRTLISLYDEVCQDKNISGDIIGKLQEHQYYLRKELQYKLQGKMMS